MITHHTQLLNYLITRYGLKSYLELGVQEPKNNFDKIACKNKWGVDPEVSCNLVSMCTSDDFFKIQIRDMSSKCGPDFFIKEKWDLVFIDGYHESQQVKRDFENSLRCLNDGGFIVLHDTCPDEEQYTIVPRQTRKWFGDVYKLAMGLANYPGIGVATLDIDCGITIVWKDPNNQFGYSPRNFCWEEDWDSYLKHKSILLNIITPSDLEKYLPECSDPK